MNVVGPLGYGTKSVKKHQIFDPHQKIRKNFFFFEKISSKGPKSPRKHKKKIPQKCSQAGAKLLSYHPKNDGNFASEHYAQCCSFPSFFSVILHHQTK
jgi:hypothetical protein